MRVDDSVSQLDQPVVFVPEPFDVQLCKIFYTRRMLGGRAILSSL